MAKQKVVDLDYVKLITVSDGGDILSFQIVCASGESEKKRVLDLPATEASRMAKELIAVAMVVDAMAHPSASTSAPV